MSVNIQLFSQLVSFTTLSLASLNLVHILVYAWYAALVTGVLATVALVIGLILVLTGLIGWCPLYSLFGMSTRQSQT